MQLTATDFYTYLRPSKCELRVFLRHRGEPEAKPSPYEEVIRRLGQRHERAHLALFPEFEDLSGGTREDREQRTRLAVHQGTPVVYQGVLRASASLNGVACEISGDPDFLIKRGNGYAIRDSKISRRITEQDHPEILHQVALYGWLYQQVFMYPPEALEVHSGTGEIVAVPFDGGATALKQLAEVLRLKLEVSEPYSPVGWSKCGACGFNDRCWPAAEKRRDAALVSGVDQNLAIALKAQGVESVEQLLSKFNEQSLAGFQRPWGKGQQRVGKKAGAILVMAESLVSGKEILLEKPALHESENYVMFDLEGLPPQLDELDKIYLWGIQVFGRNAGPFEAATAGFGPDGDRQGWEEFLSKAGAIFKAHGDVPFVHWHHYERVKLDAYIERYGDPNGIAARVRQNLMDLLPITQKSIALPLPSYSLKVVEGYVGFKRTQEEYGGDWAMAKYIEATETGDEKQRAQVMQQILDYNREDLEATWAVLRWLRSKLV